MENRVIFLVDDTNNFYGMIQIKWKPCFADPYVKVWLMFGEKRVEKKKTPVYKCNLNPTFNQVTWITKINYDHIFFIKFSFLDVWVWCALGANSWLCPWHRGKFRYLSGSSSKHHQHHQWWFTILLDFILNNISGIHIRILFVFKKRGANIIITTIMMIVMIKQVMDFDTIGRNEMIGRLMLGCKYQE